jgi:glycosyltransferase involved in cell wall biosynthesis
MTVAISVILPVHNRSDVLGRAIQSVLDQTLKDFELIVIDDGSTDASVGVAKSLADQRIKIIELGENRGGNAARNAGVRAASAPLIAFLDSDDTYLPEKLETVAAQFVVRPGLDLLVDSFVKIQPSGARVTRKNPVITDRETFRKALFQRQLWKATPSITVKRDVALRAPFDETLRRLQDFDFLIRVSEFANCAATDQVLWVKYWDAGAISAEDNMIPANIELVRRHPEYLSVRDYRPGLAYILRLSLWRRLKKGDASGILRDIRNLRQAFGPRETTRLLLEATKPRPRFDAIARRAETVRQNSL